jgi:hypothetical protein
MKAAPQAEKLYRFQRRRRTNYKASAAGEKIKGNKY